MVLAGDVGATNARFALFDVAGRKILHQEVLSSRAHPSLESAVSTFLEGAPPVGEIAAASFGIAGPVVDQRVRTTNLPWRIDARQVAREFSLPIVTLFNDLVAQGFGALAAGPKKQFVVHLGRPKKRGGNLGIIAAGTGLGPDWSTLQADWHAALAPVLAAAGVAAPQATPFRSEGRSGRHSEHMGYLLAEMQHLQRSFPGAVW